MSDDIWKAIIGAVATVCVALINSISLERTKGDGKDTKIRSLTATRTFVWVIAPIAGALIALLISEGLNVIASTTSAAVKAPFCLQGYFFPSGFMGDGEKGTEAIELKDRWTENCHSGPTCVKVVYHPLGKGWAGVYWQYPNDNWGDSPGRKIEGAKKLVFWVRGQKGGETIDFKSGGINDPKTKYHDSFAKLLDTKKLTTDWQQFEIDLNGADTSSVIGAFAWIAQKNANPQGVTFYLDGICFQ
jgi:hypothetical protein